MNTECACETVIVDPLGLVLHWQDGMIASMDLVWSRVLSGGAGSPGGEEGREAGQVQEDRKVRHRFLPASTHGDRLSVALADYLAGRLVAWPELPLDWDRPAPFHKKVLRVLMDMPWGTATTYGGLAGLAGNRRAARAVGQVMASNPWPLVVPCHRVLAGGGRLGGFGGQGLPMKRFLLDLERIPYRDLT